MRLAWVKCEAPQKDVVHFCPVLALLSTFVQFCPLLSGFVPDRIAKASQERRRRVKGGSKEDQRRIKGGSKEDQRRIKAASKEDRQSIAPNATRIASA